MRNDEQFSTLLRNALGLICSMTLIPCRRGVSMKMIDSFTTGPTSTKSQVSVLNQLCFGWWYISRLARKELKLCSSTHYGEPVSNLKPDHLFQLIKGSARPFEHELFRPLSKIWGYCIEQGEGSNEIRVLTMSCWKKENQDINLGSKF